MRDDGGVTLAWNEAGFTVKRVDGVRSDATAVKLALLRRVSRRAFSAQRVDTHIAGPHPAESKIWGYLNFDKHPHQYALKSENRSSFRFYLKEFWLRIRANCLKIVKGTRSSSRVVANPTEKNGPESVVSPQTGLELMFSSTSN